MNTVKMRKILREAGQKVPRSNEELEAAYKEYIGGTKVINEAFVKENTEKRTVEPPIKLVSSNIYTYVGMGDEPPHKIKFMDVQWFTRGLAAEVKPEILEKVSKHACFRKGKVDMDEFYEKDEIEKKKAERQREEDLKLQIEMERANRRA